MNRNAMRRPSPVRIIAREMKKAQRTIQTIGSAYPFRESAGDIVPVSAIAVTPNRTIELAGAGRTIEPTIVAAKIASSRHEAGVIPWGRGARRMSTAVPTTIPQRHHTPSYSCGGGDAGVPGGLPTAEVEEAMAAEYARQPLVA